MARLAEYLRRSSLGEEDKNYSIENQHDDVVRWIAKQGHTIVKTYSDPGGKSYTLNRPVFQQMMAEAKAGLFDVVVVGRWDRFSRIQDQQAVAIYQLGRYGVNVVSATQAVPDGPMGTLVRNNYAFAAELELYNIRERTMAGRKARCRRGKLLPAPFPLYGYVWADPDEPHGKSRYIPDTQSPDGIASHAATQVVVTIFDLVLHGMTLRQIAKKLTEEEVLTPYQLQAARGKLPRGKVPTSAWHVSSLKRILTNPAYIGRQVAWQVDTQLVSIQDELTGAVTERVRKLKRPEDHPDRIVFDEEACPALVTEDIFTAVQTVLKDHRKKAFRNMHNPEAALLRNGFAICGYCGRNMLAYQATQNRRYRYSCSRRTDPSGQREVCEGKAFSMDCEALDVLVWNWIIHSFEHPDVVRAKFEHWKAEEAAGRSIEYDRLATLDTLIKNAQRRRENYLRSEGEAADGETWAEYHELVLKAAKQIREYTEERDQLWGVLSHMASFDKRVDELVEMGKVARDHLRDANFEDKRAVLQAFGVKVRVWKGNRFDVSWRFDELHELWVKERLGVCVPNQSYSVTT